LAIAIRLPRRSGQCRPRRKAARVGSLPVARYRLSGVVLGEERVVGACAKNYRLRTHSRQRFTPGGQK
jgi:hypothetical protein